MDTAIQRLILKATGAQKAKRLKTVQRLWSGYGEIVRYGLRGCNRDSIIVKHVKLDNARGLQYNLSHQRKLRSYQIETAWYQDWSRQCDQHCRVPDCLAVRSFTDQTVMILEDLDAAGFPARCSFATDDEIFACLRWLAHFHATFMHEQPEGLWPTGTYWHLDTRPEELNALNDPALKAAAAAIDKKLRNSPYQTIVHGDAKCANFCFSKDGKQVAAVDFQYVGGGPGIKDVAYFLDSCLDGDECERRQDELLDAYFHDLKQALTFKRKSVDVAAIEHDWRALYPFAWTDFHRFLKGWSPGHWPANSFSERLAKTVISQLQTQRSQNAAIG